MAHCSMKWRLLRPKSIGLLCSKNPEYFRLATPELEYGCMNIGSRPLKRKPSGGIESLRAIPWIFAWTQTRFHLPVWLGFGAAIKHVVQKDVKNLHMLKDMYKHWPFFRVTIDLIEMVFAKGDPGIAALYDKLLVSEELWPFCCDGCEKI
ncbi:PREDICTED: phosphoenolpyruvate carboxylase 1-like [Brassica oleracea var. oleracea]|uniref:Phosphoenolpyruvate carboxylase n=1 Tax=Brassica oleracea var. oleracea TaxID=109376 RepID=A0A0D3CQF1_BRAOL|nr:PREDICTED: phosphoenolpyruvate carboxylase 1-like [Brassica oleracea var. oleracea]